MIFMVLLQAFNWLSWFSSQINIHHATPDIAEQVKCYFSALLMVLLVQIGLACACFASLLAHLESIFKGPFFPLR